MWTWTYARYDAWKNPVPGTDGVSIVNGVLSDDGRWVYASLGRKGDTTTSTVRIDLDTGTWESTGGYGTQYLTTDAGHAPIVALMSIKDERRKTAFIDTNTGNVLGRGRIDLVPEALQERWIEVHQKVHHLRLSDGSRLWRKYPHLMVTRDGKDSVLVDGKDKPWSHWLGRFQRGSPSYGPSEVYDPWRGRIIQWPPSPQSTRRAQIMAVRPGKWVIREYALREFFGDRIASWELMLWDPDTDERTPCAGVGEGDSLAFVGSDGRVLARDRSGYAAWVDPETGHSDPVRIPGAPDTRFESIWTLDMYGQTTVAPDGELVVRVRIDGFQGLGKLRQDGTLRLARATRTGSARRTWRSGCSVLRIGDDDSVLFIQDGCRIVRGWFGSDRMEVLFPKP